MRRIFIATNQFWSLWIKNGLGDDDIRRLEDELIRNPQAGDVIRDTGGLRKLRWGYRGMGKRGSLRILYVDVPEYDKLFFISLLKKGEKADLSMSEKRDISVIIKEIKEDLKNRKYEKAKSKK